MTKRYKALVVCGTGMGSSLLLKLMAEKVVTQNNLPIQVTSDVAAAARTSDADFFIAGLDLVPVLEKLGRPVIGIKNILDTREIADAVRRQLEVMEHTED